MSECKHEWRIYLYHASCVKCGVDLLDACNRRGRENDALRRQVSHAEKALVDSQCEKAQLILELKRERSEGAEIERRLHIAYESRQELRKKRKRLCQQLAAKDAALKLVRKVINSVNISAWNSNENRISIIVDEALAGKGQGVSNNEQG